MPIMNLYWKVPEFNIICSNQRPGVDCLPIKIFVYKLFIPFLFTIIHWCLFSQNVRVNIFVSCFAFSTWLINVGIIEVFRISFLMLIFHMFGILCTKDKYLKKSLSVIISNLSLRFANKYMVLSQLFTMSLKYVIPLLYQSVYMIILPPAFMSLLFNKISFP